MARNGYLILIAAAIMSNTGLGSRAQDIVVSYWPLLQGIGDDAAVPNFAHGTDFGEVAVAGGTSFGTFEIGNLDQDTLLAIEGPITITGAHFSDFTIPAQPDSPVTAGASKLFNITFNPSAAGSRTATVTIPNSDPDATQGTFTFNIRGTGLNTLPLAKPNLEVGLVKLKTKYDKTTGKITVSAKVPINNIGTVPVASSNLEIFEVNALRIDSLEVPTQTINVETLDAGDSTSVKFEHETYARSAWLAIRIMPAPASIQDSNYNSNQKYPLFGITPPP